MILVQILIHLFQLHEWEMGIKVFPISVYYHCTAKEVIKSYFQHINKQEQRGFCQYANVKTGSVDFYYFVICCVSSFPLCTEFVL